MNFARIPSFFASGSRFQGKAARGETEHVKTRKAKLSEKMPSGSVFVRHTVANAHFGQNIFRLRRIFFNFSPDICHVYP